jgi:hypothetical protein
VTNASASLTSPLASPTGFNVVMNGFSGLTSGVLAMFNTGAANIFSLDARL